MRIEPEDYLRLVEQAETLCFFDIETTGLQADYGKTLVFSWAMGPKRAPQSYLLNTKDDKILVQQARDILNVADCWVSYNGKMFDKPYLNSRLLEHNLALIDQKPHVDMYFVLKHKIRTGSKALGNVARWLQLKEDKMSLPPKSWRDQDMPLLKRRCESDVKLLQQLYLRTKHLIRDINR